MTRFALAAVLAGTVLTGACDAPDGLDSELPPDSSAAPDAPAASDAPGAPEPPGATPAPAPPDSAAFTTIRGETDLIVVESPLPGAVVTSPLTVRGRARGGWYFEGDFPVVLTNWDGLIIAEDHASALGEWMTSEFVPFEAVLEFEVPADMGEFSRRGSLILQKANPSGLAELDDAIEFTVYFRPPQ